MNQPDTALDLREREVRYIQRVIVDGNFAAVRAARSMNMTMREILMAAVVPAGAASQMNARYEGVLMQHRGVFVAICNALAAGMQFAADELLYSLNHPDYLPAGMRTKEGEETHTVFMVDVPLTLTKYHDLIKTRECWHEFGMHEAALFERLNRATPTKRGIDQSPDYFVPWMLPISGADVMRLALLGNMRQTPMTASAFVVNTAAARVIDQFAEKHRASISAWQLRLPTHKRNRWVIELFPETEYDFWRVTHPQWTSTETVAGYGVAIVPASHAEHMLGETVPNGHYRFHNTERFTT